MRKGSFHKSKVELLVVSKRKKPKSRVKERKEVKVRNKETGTRSKRLIKLQLLDVN